MLRHPAGHRPLQPKLKLPRSSLCPQQPHLTRESVPPSLGSCALRLSTTLFPKAATASTGEKKQRRGSERGQAPRCSQQPRS